MVRAGNLSLAESRDLDFLNIPTRPANAEALPEDALAVIFRVLPGAGRSFQRGESWYYEIGMGGGFESWTVRRPDLLRLRGQIAESLRVPWSPLCLSIPTDGDDVLCNRDLGHDGRHAALGPDGEVIAWWTDDDPEARRPPIA
jgi:hypothetical protein